MVVVFIPLVYATRLDVIAWYLWHNFFSTEESSAFELGEYEVEIDGKRIPGVSDASGLTFHAPTGTLFSVLNDEPTIVRLSRQGEVLREIKVEGVSDMEGITHVSNNQFVVVEEGKNRLILIEIWDEEHINIADQPNLTLGFENDTNKGLEGISWDAKGERILVVSEKSPSGLWKSEVF